MEPLRPDDPRELGGYRLLRRVGEGGMGVVYLATSADGAGADLAAVKAVRAEYAGDREFRARFTVEADLARRVRGPYTARVLDADTDGPRPWLATEYVPGPALQDAVRDTGPFPEGSLLALASGLARALSAIHEVGLVHRDLKPSNVLLSARGPQVIDFGIARAADATALTRTGQALGTPGYMSPEQATGSGLHGASDLFSFGGVLVFAATGRAPFGSGEPAALLYRVVNEEPDLSGLPDPLFPLVSACLAKDPEERPGLDAVVAELSGTALPSADDETTEWLPGAIGATVHHTLVAATRILPGGETGDDGQDVDGGPATDAEDGGTARAEESVPERAEVEDTSGERPMPEAGPAGEDRSPAEADAEAPEAPPAALASGPEEHSAEPASATRPPTSAQEVPDGQSSAEREAPEPETAEEAASEASPSDDDAAPDEDNRDRASEPEGHPAEGPNTSGRAPTAAAEASAPDAGRDPRAPEPAESGAPGVGTPAGSPIPAPVPDSSEASEEPGPAEKAEVSQPKTPDARRAAAWRAAVATPSPASAAPPAPPASRGRKRTSVGAKVLVGAAAVALVLVNGLLMHRLDVGADDNDLIAGGSGTGEDPSEEQEERDPAEIEDIAPLSDDRFAVVSNHGVHVYDIDDAEPVERLSEDVGLEPDDDPDADLRIGGPTNEDTGDGEGVDFTRSHLATTPDGSTVAARSGLGDGVVHVWDVESGDQHAVALPTGTRWNEALALSPDGGTVFVGVWGSGDDEPLAMAFGVENGEKLFSVHAPEGAELSAPLALDTSPDGDLLLGSLSDGLAAWDATSGEAPSDLPEVMEATGDQYGSMTVGDGVAVTAGRGAPSLWELAPPSEPQELPLPGGLGTEDDNLPVSQVALSTDGERVISAGSARNRGFVGVWDLAGDLVAEHAATERSYSALAATPSGHGALVVEHALITDEDREEDHPHNLRLLDENLETELEYELPTR